MPVNAPTVPVIVIPYSCLVTHENSLYALLEEAYGTEGLGILTVSGIPGLEGLRACLLPLAPNLANLPREVLATLEDPDSSYTVGWSRGNETLEGGQTDTWKGSFYANPIMDTPSTDAHELLAFPHFCRPNIWPDDALPQLRAAFQGLGRLIVEVGLLLAEACDHYVASRVAKYGRGSISRCVGEAAATKGRLLHYYPMQEARTGPGADTWCGWHTDTGSLTGLTSAMYMRDGRDEVACPDPFCGLHVRNRQGEVVRVQIPADHLGYQVGEAMQIQSGGLLRATPHYVKAARGDGVAGMARNTFAVFMQPRWDEVLNPPPGIPDADVGVGEWRPNITFGELGRRTFKKNYG